MERRGFGLHKIVEATKALPEYMDSYMPRFVSTDPSFKVILKNVNYNANSAIDDEDSSIDMVNTAIDTANSAIESKLAGLKWTRCMKEKLMML